jgi:hypothetical protein
MSTLSRPAGRIEGCGVEPFTPFDTRSALLRTLTSVTLTQPWFYGPAYTGVIQRSCGAGRITICAGSVINGWVGSLLAIRIRAR